MAILKGGKSNASKISHNSLSSLQGGSAGEYYHLTEEQSSKLTSGHNSDSLHTHSHSSLLGSGSYTHAQIDGHLDDSSIHRKISGDPSSSSLWSGSKIRFEIDNSEQNINHNSLSSIQGGIANERYHLSQDQESKLTSGGIADTYHIHNHSSLQGSGGYTHAQIDVHLDDSSIHRKISEDVTATNLWSGSKIKYEVDNAAGTTEHNELSNIQGGLTGEYYHLTEDQESKLTSGGIADTYHIHNHSSLQGSGSYTHAQIDGHLDDSSIHRKISADETASNLWSGSKIRSEINFAEPVLYHNNLSGIQGGSSDNHYHLTEAQQSQLTSSQDASGQHHHDSRYYTETELTDGNTVDLNVNSLRTSSNITIGGDLIVNGSQVIANTETVLIEDNLLIINNGEVGAGVTKGEAGIQVDRGTLTGYQFIFDESSDTFRIGESNLTQAAATREDSPVDNGLAFWNDSEKRFDTSNSILVTSLNALTNSSVADSLHKHTHSSLLGAGFYSHSQIDNHINDSSIHRGISGDTTATNLWSGSKIRYEVDNATGTTEHNELSNIQGGTAGEYYHLTADQESKLTSGGDASTYHTHDDRYYTESETDNLLSTKANSSHIHDASDITSGTFDNTRISVGNITQHEGSINHDNLLNTHNLTTDIVHSSITGAGLNSHSAIDAHIDDSSIHRKITADETATNLWSGSKIRSEINFAEPTIYHNALSSIQGGTTGEYYHLTADQESKLTSGGNATTYHIHDDRYYTESESDSLLNDKANVSHIHDASDITTGTFDNARISVGNVTQHEGSINHDNLLNTHNLTTDIVHSSITGAGLNSHSAIDLHIDDSSIHRRIAADETATNLWSGSKIRYELQNVSSVGGTSNHNLLTNLQGGTTNEYYHLTADQESKLTSGGNATTYHIHDDRYYTETEVNSLLNDKANVSHIHDASDITSGTFDNARISVGNVTQHEGSINHDNLLNTHNLTTDIVHSSITGAGINSHSAIDLHIDNSSIHRQISPGETATNLWSGSKIRYELQNVSSVGGTSDHNLLTNLQGGTSGQYYHLTADQESKLTSGGDASIYHIHDDRYYTNSQLTDGSLNLTVNNLDVLSNLSVYGDQTITSNLTVGTLSGGPNQIVTVNSSGKLELSGSTISDLSGSALASTLTGWTLEASNIYYADIVHNFGTKDLFVETKENSNDTIVLVEDIVFTDDNTVRVKTYGNSTDIRVVISPTANGADAGAGGGGGGGATHLSGMIGTTSSAGDFSAVDNWSGSPGNYQATITLATAIANPYNIHFKFYTESAGVYTEVVPMKVECLTTSTFEIYMPTDGDLYVDAI